MWRGHAGTVAATWRSSLPASSALAELRVCQGRCQAWLVSGLLTSCLALQAASKTNDTAGDGTTTATILSAAIIAEGMKIVAAGTNPIQVRRAFSSCYLLVSTVSLQHAGMGSGSLCCPYCVMCSDCIAAHLQIWKATLPSQYRDWPYDTPGALCRRPVVQALMRCLCPSAADAGH